MKAVEFAQPARLSSTGDGMSNRWDELMRQLQALITEVSNEHASQVRTLQAEMRLQVGTNSGSLDKQSASAAASSMMSMLSHPAPPSNPVSSSTPMPSLPSGVPPDLQFGPMASMDEEDEEEGDAPQPMVSEKQEKPAESTKTLGKKSILVARSTPGSAPSPMPGIGEERTLHDAPPPPTKSDLSNVLAKTAAAAAASAGAKRRESNLRFQFGELVVPHTPHEVAMLDPTMHAHAVIEAGWDPAAMGGPRVDAERQAIESLSLCSAPRNETQNRRRQTLQKYKDKDFSHASAKGLQLGPALPLSSSPSTTSMGTLGLSKRISFSQISKVPRGSLTAVRRGSFGGMFGGLSKGGNSPKKRGSLLTGPKNGLDEQRQKQKIHADNGGARDSFSMLPLADRLGGGNMAFEKEFKPLGSAISDIGGDCSGSLGRLSCPYEDEYDELDPEHRKIKAELKSCWAQKLAKEEEGATLKWSSSKNHLSCMTSIDLPVMDEKEVEKSKWQRVLRPFVSHPSTPQRLAFDLVGMLFLGLDLVMVPLQAFGEHARLDSPGLVTLAFVSSIYWTIDFLCAFLVGYHTKGFVEMSPKRIMIRYLKTWFILDFTLVIVDWTFISLGFTQQASYMRVGKTMSRAMRALRLLRIVKMHTVLAELMEQIRSEYMRTICSVGSLVFFIVIINHFIACAWYAIGHGMMHSDRNWVRRYLTEEESLGYRYATSLHWSLTQFTPASMEVVPQNSLERVYSVCVLLFALITFSSFVSSITQAMSHLRNINIRKLEQQQVLRRYLNQHGISTALVNRVWHYLHQRNVMNSGKVRTKERDVPMLDLLPGSMRVELRMEAFTPELHRHPFFMHYFQIDPGAARQICSHVLTELSLLTRHELFSEGSTNIHMFFLVEGSLEYLLPCACAAIDNCNKQYQDENDGEGAFDINWDEDEGDFCGNTAGVDPCDHVACGQWACEVALWTTRVELCGPFVAMEKSEVLLVNSAEFQQVLSKHKSKALQVAKYAQAFVQHLDRMTRCRWRIAMCNDFSVLEDLVHRELDTRDVGKSDKRRNARSVGDEAALRKKGGKDPLGLDLASSDSDDYSKRGRGSDFSNSSENYNG